jgi:carbonic anhydrase
MNHDDVIFFAITLPPSVMKKSYTRLLEGNKQWARSKVKAHPLFFRRLSRSQHPQYLWIGCSDSRVPANEVTATESGEIFVHRNLANLVIQTDMNLLSVLYYAVDILKVKHVIVCGHYGCGGIRAAMENRDHGFVNNWLRNVKEVYLKHKAELEQIRSRKKREDRLTELNVMEQVNNLAKTRIVQRAWKNSTLQIHGWVYDFRNGLITDLNCMKKEIRDLEHIFRYIL